MATNNSGNQKFTNNADGFDIAGGTTARKFTVSGADIGIAGSGAETMTMPAASDTLVGRTSTDTLTNKTLAAPVITLANATPTADGSIAFNTTDEDVVIGDGTLSRKIHLGVWTAYTPTITNGTNVDGTLLGYYQLVGTTVNYFIYWLLGASSAITGSLQLSLPFTHRFATGYGTPIVTRNVRLRDASGAVNALGVHYSTGAVHKESVSGTDILTATVTATVPWTWAVGDYIHIQGSYEIA